MESFPRPLFAGFIPPVWAAVAALLALYAALALTASTRKGTSFDEGEELAVGYNIWIRHDLRMEAANGDLVKRWATLPLLVSRPHFPSEDNPSWRNGQPYEIAFQFLFRSGNNPQSLLFQGRAMIAILGIATGLLVFACSRELFGNVGGLISLSLFAFSPHMLAFGALVGTTIPLCLTLLGSTWCIWHLMHRVTWGRLALSLVLFGLLVLAKPSAVVIFPITAILLGAKLLSGRPLEWRLGRSRLVTSRAAQAGLFSILIVAHGICGWTSIWAHYGFRYVASPNPSDPGIVFRKQISPDPVDPAFGKFIGWSRSNHFLPEGCLHGIEWLLRQDERRSSFMDGKWKIGGWGTFFLYAIWVKSSPEFLLAVLVGLGVWWRARHRAKKGLSEVSEPPAPSAYMALPYFILVIVYLGVATAQNVNIGHRHILPIYPALYVLCGSLSLVWSSRPAWGRAAVAVLLVLLAAEAAAVFPDYLAYFSPLVGGPARGYRHLVDSSLDWGMDLPGLKRWLQSHNPADRDPVFLAYFGTGDPDYYQIKCTLLPCVPDWRPYQIYPLGPGFYAISATLLQTVGTAAFGPWNRVYEQAYKDGLANLALFNQTANDPAARSGLLKRFPPEFWQREYVAFERLRFARLSAWLRHRTPDDEVGRSILIWKLDDRSLNAALEGPPAELADAPVRD